jgi:hypothetical protein
MRRAWSRILLTALIVSITFLYPLLAPTPHRIDRDHADLIVQGMTKRQVEAIFAVPAGQYDWAETDGLTWFDFDGDGWTNLLVANYAAAAGGAQAAILVVEAPGRTSLTWTSRHGAFMVWFDQQDRVVSTNSWTEVRIVPPWQRWWSRFWKK